jgi:hypothetical protein
VCALDPAGGTCPPATPTPTPTSTPACFANGAVCASSAQCCSGSCSGGVCAPSCTNGFQDGSETGVDCGGGTCPGCPLGGGCTVDNDCVTTTQCSGGQCVCDPGRSDCNGVPGDGCEVNTQFDNTNCGACGNVCTLPNAAEICNMAQCLIAFCDSGYSDCNGITADGCETNTQFDPNNCGGCNVVCPNPLTCVNAVCN